MHGMMFSCHRVKKPFSQPIGCVLFIVLAGVIFLFANDAAARSEQVKVKRVIDGDTVLLKDGRYVRLLGINTPETSRGIGASEPGAIAAKNALAGQLKGKIALLQLGAEKMDQYGRVLGYLFTLQGINLNRLLVRQGFAHVNIYPPNLKYSKQIINDQRGAEIEGLGIWGMDEYKRQEAEIIVKKKLKKWGRYVAKVTCIKASKKGTTLCLGSKVNIWIKTANRKYFPNLQQYLNKRIEIRGWPRKWRRQWSIQARHPSQIIIDES